MQQNDCYLSDEQKDVIRKIAGGLRNKTIEAQWSLKLEGGRIINNGGLPAEIAEKISDSDLKTFSDCGFVQKITFGLYKLHVNRIFNAVEFNFGEAMQQPKSQFPQRLYKGLNEEQWKFLSLMATALRGKYIYPKGKKGRYFAPVMSGEIIVEFEGLNGSFVNANRNELYISPKDFLDLVGKGYFERARNDNFYLIESKIFPSVDDYQAQNNNSPAKQYPNLLMPADNEFHCDVFMVMPFRDGLNDVYENIIVPLSRELSLSIKRGDERQRASASIVDEVLVYIESAKIILVDCTEIDEKPNGNVYYELGYADALGHENVIIISQTDATSLPFDVRHRGVIHYKDNAKGLGKLREDLKKEIQSILDN